MRRVVFLLALLLPSSVIAQGLSKYTPIAKVTVAYSSVGASYASFYTAGQALRDFDIYNGTDQSITCSVDGGTSDNFDIPAYSNWSPNLAEAGKYFQYTVHCKRTSSAPTVGNVVFSGGY